jgi:hypothetical protein
MTTPYHTLACLAGNADAHTLADELTRWHDRMVAHVRRHGAAPPTDCCGDDDCPSEAASSLWQHAQRAYGARADSLTFLMARASRRSR